MRRPWILAGGLVAAIVLGACLPLLLGRAAPVWDASSYFGPHFSLTADYAKAGRLELWNPWINAGAPDFAEPQLGTASPVLLSFALLSPNPFSGFIAYWLAVWIFGGIGMILLCKHLGAPVWGAAVIALGFVASGVYTGNAEHTSFVYSFSFLPWTVWRFDKSLEERSYGSMAQAGILWGLSGQGGYPGVTITVPIFLTLWGIGRAWTGGQRRFTDVAMALLIVGSLGFAVMSPAYISFLKEGRGYSYRADGLDRNYALSSNALPPEAYATLASPALYQLRRPDHRAIWPDADISMTNVYMGVLVTVLALAALGHPSRWRIWLALLTVFFGCCAVGSHLPVRGWLYDLLPPTRYFRHPSLFRMYVIVLACVLAAHAARDLETNWSKPLRPRSGGVVFLLSAIAAVVAMFAYAATMHSISQPMSAQPYAMVQLLITWLGTSLILLLAWRGLGAPSVWAAGLVLLAAGDAASALIISSPTVYDAGSLPSWRAMETGHVSSLDVVANGWTRTFWPPEAVGSSRNNRNVALKAATFDSRVPLKNEVFTHYLDEPLLSRLALGAERVWFSDHPVWLAPTEANFAAFSQVSHELGFPILVLHKAPEMTEQLNQSLQEAAAVGSALRTAPVLTPAQADLFEYQPNALSFRYHADRDGWLLVTDRWASAWTVTVDGREQPVLGGNFIFRAVAVGRGDNVIEFRYQPRGYFAWVALSWSVLAGAIVWQLRRRRRAATPNRINT